METAKASERSEEPGGTLRREQQEQKRLLADTHTVTMDLRCRMEHSERGWVRERSELLERFDLERKEWESQLRDMQRKIEEVSGKHVRLSNTAQLRVMAVALKQKSLLSSLLSFIQEGFS